MSSHHLSNIPQLPEQFDPFAMVQRLWGNDGHWLVSEAELIPTKITAKVPEISGASGNMRL